MAATKLQTTRKLRGYKAADVIRQLIVRAEQLNVPVMSPVSLKTKLSEWENGHSAVSEPYQKLFRDIYGRTNEELGFPPELEDDDAAELRARLAVARSVDAETIDRFRKQVDDARHVDRKYGGVILLDQLRSLIRQLEQLLGYSTVHEHRAALSRVLTEASTLAGWISLDRNAIVQAWNHYERAKSAAREADDTPALAHATAEQAFVLVDLGESAQAAEQLTHARSIGQGAVPALLQAWLAAAYGEGLAVVGQRDYALRAFDDAMDGLPTDPVDPALPFLFLGDSHLDRWRGNALARLGDPDAIQQLADALPRLPAAFVRAKVGMLVDLAYAHAAADDRDGALRYSREARRLGMQIKSDRHLRRLQGLILPGSALP
ncbi:tetratricopeptide repeat protein [Amycolatopsis sp. GM8]|uniref:tetratricopeptide repeat protein n=1 Tax=Amycolatopsis sp. GM8 TaxID=2896530 RepID=UPI001F357991|nr:tetratricopeptide repeat protein [Amycolatopsis sp. GM8]